MKKNRRSLFLGITGLLIALTLVTGCYKEAVPDVTATPASGVQAVPVDEGTPDLEATGIANATLAAQPVEGAEVSPTEVPTLPPPTPIPTLTPVSPTLVPTMPPPATLTPEPPPTSPPASGTVTHVVQRGENLFHIALRYGTTVEAIASANSIANPALIYVGQELTISSSGAQPDPQPGGATTYVVQAGDNLFRIALRYGMNYLQLAQYNSIANPSRIYVGQVLRIPSH